MHSTYPPRDVSGSGAGVGRRRGGWGPGCGTVAAFRAERARGRSDGARVRRETQHVAPACTAAPLTSLHERLRRRRVHQVEVYEVIDPELFQRQPPAAYWT